MTLMYLVSRNVKQYTCHVVPESPVYDKPPFKEGKGLFSFDKGKVKNSAGSRIALLSGSRLRLNLQVVPLRSL